MKVRAMRDHIMGKPTIPERELQSQICQHLTLLGWFVIEYARPGGHEALRGAAPPGHPDLLCIKRGRHRFLEVKTPLGILSNAQERMIADLSHAGAFVRVVRSVEEAEAAVEGAEIG